MPLSFKKLPGGRILEESAGTVIGDESNENPLWVAYQEWLTGGGDPGEPPEVTIDITPGIEMRGRVQTAGVVSDILYRLTLNTMTVYDMEATVVGIDLANAAVRKVKATATVKRTSGNAAMVGAVVVLASQGDAAALTWSILVSVSGTDLVVSVTGALTRNILWAINGKMTWFAATS